MRLTTVVNVCGILLKCINVVSCNPEFFAHDIVSSTSVHIVAVYVRIAFNCWQV